MAKGSRGRRRIALRQCSTVPYSLPLCNEDGSECMDPKKNPKHLGKKDWEDVNCPVCMEYPHNAVLLLCSSHDKGCRPYMCATSFRYSNCLDQYKKAYTKVTRALNDLPLNGPVDNSEVGPVSDSSAEKCEATELVCPLCRGQVKGWTVVKPAREYLNAKTRSCMQDNCSFVGTYKGLRKHVKLDHPCARPREVDPDLEQKWKSLVRERERDDVLSTIRSSMPGAMVLGDYVIEGSHYGFDSNEEDGFDVDAVDGNEVDDLGIDSNLLNVFLLLHALRPGGNGGQTRRLRRRERESDNISHGSLTSFEFPDQENGSYDDASDDGGENGGMSLVHRLRRQGRVLLGRSGRRQRRREAANGGRQ